MAPVPRGVWPGHTRFLLAKKWEAKGSNFRLLAWGQKVLQIHVLTSEFQGWEELCLLVPSTFMRCCN